MHSPKGEPNRDESSPASRSRRAVLRRTALGASALTFGALGLGGTAGAASVADPERPELQASAQALPNPDPDPFDRFGWSVTVSADGRTALVGSPSEHTDTYFAVGEAYVFEQVDSRWTFVETLTNPDPDSADHFGQKVGLSADGRTALVTAPGVDDTGNAGEGYVFKQTDSEWAFTATLTQPDPNAEDGFGAEAALSADGDTALVAAPREGSTGRTYVFERADSGWAQNAALVPPDLGLSDGLGYSVAVSADGCTALVGVPYGEPEASEPSEAYVFERTGSEWALVDTLSDSSPDPDGDGEFGWSVALNAGGCVALVGRLGDYDERVGEAYVFERTDSGWVLADALPNPASDPSDRFAETLALDADGRVALVGAVGLGSGGKAYVFVRTDAGWTLAGALSNPDPSELSNEFGRAVALSADGRTALVDASVPVARRAGEAYAFTLDL